MKNTKKKIIYPLILLLFFTACKYEDGPLISFRSKHARLNGRWKFKEVLVDGVDSTAAYQQRFPSINFISNQELWSSYVRDVNMEFWINKALSPDGIYGQGNFNKNKTKLYVDFMNQQYSLGPIGSMDDQEWEVLKLSNVNLWFKINFNNKEYIFKLKAK